eukprot:7036148-Heterocapsa_arctica.AAC.1
MERGGHKAQCHVGEEAHAVWGAGSHHQEHHCRRPGDAPLSVLMNRAAARADQQDEQAGQVTE